LASVIRSKLPKDKWFVASGEVGYLDAYSMKGADILVSPRTNLQEALKEAPMLLIEVMSPFNVS